MPRQTEDSPPVLIGIDIGTGSVKAAMLDTSGQRLDSFAAPYPTRRPLPGHAEQDPDDWMAAVRRVLEKFSACPGAARVAAIGVTSQVNTHVFCDAALTPLVPAIVWQDGRAAAVAAALDGRIGAAARIAALGAPIPIDASHALARMAWVAATHPEVWARTAHVLLPKDHVIARLTGHVRADPISAVGLVGPDLAYAGAILDLLPGAARRLAPLCDPRAEAGRMRTDLPFAGVPVVTGLMDAWASMLGLGVANDGQAMYLSGTSEVVGLISSQGRGAKGVVTFPAWAGITLHAGPTQAGGASLDWAGRMLGRDLAAMSDLAAGVEISATSPIFLPHLDGERAPLWDPAARGAFAGLDGASGPAEIAAAVMEGVAFSVRLALEAVERAGARHVAALHLGGGGSLSDVWCQIRADALGRDLLRMRAADTGAVGAAVLAGAGAGLMPSLSAATAAMVPVERRFRPRVDAAALANRRFALYRDLYERVSPVSHALAAGA